MMAYLGYFLLLEADLGWKRNEFFKCLIRLISQRPFPGIYIHVPQTARLELRPTLLLTDRSFPLTGIMHNSLLVASCVVACLITVFALVELKLATLRRKKATVSKICRIPHIILSASLGIVSAIILKKRDTALEICWAVLLSIVVTLGTLRAVCRKRSADVVRLLTHTRWKHSISKQRRKEMPPPKIFKYG